MATYSHNPNCLTPLMTSNTTPAPVTVNISGGSVFGQPYYLFNQSVDPNLRAGVSAKSMVVTVNSGLNINNGNGWLVSEYTISSYSVNILEYPKNWTLEGSNDGGINWVVVDSQTNQINWNDAEMRSYTVATPGVYLLYRLNITANNGSNYTVFNELELIGGIAQFPFLPFSDNCLTPVMTANNAPAPVVVSASAYNLGQLYYLFNHDLNYTMRFGINNTSGWIVIYSGLPLFASYGWRVTSYALYTFSTNILDSPKNWTLEGSNDGGFTWVVVDSQTNQINWSAFGKRVFNVQTPGSYKYYRLNITANNGSAYISFNELELIGDHAYPPYPYEPNCLTPLMTSNTTPAPVTVNISGGSLYGQPYYLFNQSVDPNLRAGVNAKSMVVTVNSGLNINNGNGWLVSEYIIWSYSVNILDYPKNWTLEGSNDGGSNWVVVDSQTNQINWSDAEMRSYTVATPGVYLLYRLNITANNGYNYTVFNELKLLGSISPLLGTKTATLFFLHG